MYGSTQQSYAGPVNSGDMVVKNDQVSPGIAALLRKQNARGAQGIFQLPDTQQPNPDFYNQSLMNVQNQIKGQADTLNAMAPEGESLAYINPQEAGILKLLGGAGEPVNATGIPSFYVSQYRGGKPDKPIRQAQENRQEKAKQEAANRTKNIREAMKNFKPSQGPKPDTGNKPYIPMVAGGIGAQEFDEDAKAIYGPKYGSEDTTISGYTKDIDDNYAQQALINAYVAGAAKQAQGAAVGNVGQDALRGLSALKGQANKTFFSSDYNKMLNRAMKYGDPLTTGNTYLGSADNDLRKEGIFGDYDTEEGKRLKFALGGGTSKLGDFLSNFGLMGLLNKLFPGDEMTFDEKLKAYDAMKAQEEKQRMRKDAGTADSTGEDDTDTDDEDESEEEYPFFGYRRKIQVPLSLEDIMSRYYSSDPDRKNILEDLGAAVKRRDDS
jgi:hypothetical protein